MGVHGLWKIIDSSGKAIPLEALENRVLAVDVSIWLYQLVKGFQEAGGHSVANAYLLGLFHRICKLLFYRIKPILVFDGGVPSLKRRTIAERQSSRNKANRIGEKLRQTLLENLAKQEALGQAIGEAVVLPKLFQPKVNNLFELPALPVVENEDSSSDSEPEEERYRYKDIHSIDITSEEFLSLPADMRHDILTELKETRKQNSWGKLHLIPKESNEFSDYQMRRLLKRRAVQVGIEQAEGEMGTRGFTLSDLQTILSDQGVELAQRIAADSSTRLLYSNKIKEIVKGKENKTDGSNSKNTLPTEIKKRKLIEHDVCSDIEDDVCSDIDDPGIPLSPDKEMDRSLTQEEILQLIKQESQTVPSKETSVERVLTPPVAAKSKNVESEKEGALTVNDEAVENKPGNNDLELEHGSFPQVESPCQQSPPRPEPLSQLSTQPQLSDVVREKTKDSANGVVDTMGSMISHQISERSISDMPEGSGSPIDLNSSNKKIIKLDSAQSKKRLELLNCLNKMKEEITSPLKEPCLPTLDFKLENRPEEESFVRKSLKLIEEQSEMMVDNEPDVSDETPIKRVNLELGSESDSQTSDSDGFVEVEGEDEEQETTDIIPELLANEVSSTQSNVSTRKDSKSLEIIVNLKDDLEDDLFADIFKSSSAEINDKTSVTSLEELGKNIKLPSNQIVPEDPIHKHKEEDNVSYNSDLKSSETTYETGKVNESTEFVFYETPSSIQDSLDNEQSDLTMESPSKAPNPSPVPQLSFDEIVKMKKELEKETSYLMVETKREDRIASTITEQIRIDAQELLQLFGVPYIVAPMEAEAQCAYLDSTGQTQGTITDDSDIWLFGGKNVYKNFFDQKKFVQQFKSTDIAKVVQMERDEMIMLALLTGSDYTIGLAGVGAVTALEVVAHYPKSDSEPSPFDRLRHFAIEYQQKTLDGNIAKKLKKASLSEGFPSLEVINAYLDPEVDKSAEKFTWSKPNLTELRRYAREKFGWDKSRTDKTLEPILENLGKTQTQGTLHSFFEWKFDATAIPRSKRMENAINIMKTSSLLSDPGPSTTRTPILGSPVKLQEKKPEIPVKSKTPAQIARERAAKKFKELKKQGKIGPKSKKR